MKKVILYIGGFELPDRNAAAQRVIGIAKGLREIGNEVVFLNSLKECKTCGYNEKEYYGFKCYEYKREFEIDYLILAATILSMIRRIKPDAVIAYNYPAVALNRIRRYCNANKIKCYADVTEWYQSDSEKILYRFIKNLDSAYRMKHVHKKMDGIIAISRFLFGYYKNYVKTVMIPPTVDLSDDKWSLGAETDDGYCSLVYTGVPSSAKERLDLIISAIGETSIRYPIKLRIAGITSEQFREKYQYTGSISESVQFFGHITHKEAIDLVKKSDWSIIIRENNLLVKAGFPTKVVESISCGTPVISNRFSNVEDYLNDNNCIFINSDAEIKEIIEKAFNTRLEVNRDVFDYHNFLKELELLIP